MLCIRCIKLYNLQNGVLISMAHQQSPRKNRKAYLNDFHQSLSGEYIYCGVTYTFEGTRKQRFHLYYKLLALSVVMAAAGLVSGCITAPGTLNCFYVLIPYMISFMATISTSVGLNISDQNKPQAHF